MTIAVNVRIPAPRLSPDPSPQGRSTEQLLASAVAFLAADGRADRWLSSTRPCPCVLWGDECERCAFVTMLAQRAIAGGAP